MVQDNPVSTQREPSPNQEPTPGPMPPCVAIDARVVVGHHGHGILRYTEELVHHLATLQSPLRFVLLVNAGSPLLGRKWPPNVSFVTMRAGWISFWGQFELALVLARLRPQLFHTPSFMVPIFGYWPLVTTIHDLNHVVLSENYSLFHRIYYSVVLARKVRQAEAVITVSRFSRDQILKFFKVSSNKVKVIYNGIDDHFFTSDASDASLVRAFRERYELPERYILSIGNRKPHKNVARTVQAYCSGDFSDPLVLLSEFDPKLLAIAERYGKKHMVHFLRFVSRQYFPLVYASARVFVFPSLYEGFGFPPLEAGACGVPVVASRRASLPEVLKDGAIYVDPEDVMDIQRGLELALLDGDQTKSVVACGRRNARDYRWNKVAQETLAVYLDVLGVRADARS
jgi:glycosyltransferase involved in cell wall biosynthesis